MPSIHSATSGGYGVSTRGSHETMPQNPFWTSLQEQQQQEGSRAHSRDATLTPAAVSSVENSPFTRSYVTPPAEESLDSLSPNSEEPQHDDGSSRLRTTTEAGWTTSVRNQLGQQRQQQQQQQNQERHGYIATTTISSSGQEDSFAFAMRPSEHFVASATAGTSSHRYSTTRMATTTSAATTVPIPDNGSSPRRLPPQSGNVVFPDPPVIPVGQHDLLQSIKSWVESGEVAMGSCQTQVRDMCDQEKKACAEDVAKLREQILVLEMKVQDRENRAMKRIESLEEEAKRWEQTLSDARRTVEILSGGATNSSDEDEEASQPPNELICPITLELMQDPVIAADGQTYERAAIEETFQRAALRHRPPVSPYTNLPLQSSNLIPNVGIRSMCRKWQSKATEAVEAVEDDDAMTSFGERTGHDLV